MRVATHAELFDEIPDRYAVIFRVVGNNQETGQRDGASVEFGVGPVCRAFTPLGDGAPLGQDRVSVDAANREACAKVSLTDLEIAQAGGVGLGRGNLLSDCGKLAQ